MATRNLTRTFLTLRQNLRRRPARAGGGALGGGGDGGATGGATAGGVSFEEARSSLPPHWVDTVDDVNEDIADITRKIDQLRATHKKRLLVRFDETEGAQDRTIDILTQQTTAKFREAERKLKRIGQLRAGAEASGSEQGVRKNIQRSLAVQLQNLSMDFRKCQKAYLQQLKKQKEGNMGDLFGGGGGGGGGSDPLGGGGGGGGGFGGTAAADADLGFTDDQMLYLEQVETEVEDRDQEIVKIAKNIEELATIFKDLATLVIDQGTILDRIDYNMEQVVETTKKGMVQLNKAEEYQKSTRPLKCICVLLILILVLAIILYNKWKSNNN